MSGGRDAGTRVEPVGVDQLAEVARSLGEWQIDGAPMQLHPGDLGWHWRFGAEATAAAVRVWRRGRRIVAVGLLDSPSVLRLAMAPHEQPDEEPARQVVADVTAPSHNVLPSGAASVEARFAGPFRQLLRDQGWEPGESWTPLVRDLAQPVEDRGVRVDVVGPERAGVRAAVQRAAFDQSTFTEDRWRAMAAGSPYAAARCLIAYDDRGTAVAAATVWSSGPGRPGLLEPVGVHREHRGCGYGTVVTVAAAAALREMGASSATVCTPTVNVAAIATYASAGFRRLPDERDLHRNA